MFSPRMTFAGIGRVHPAGERPVARVGIGRGGRGQPVVERNGGPAVTIQKAAQIVIAHSAADDGHAFVAQRRQRATDRKMKAGVEIGAQRKGGDRGRGFRIGDQKRNEDAMIIAAAVVLIGWNSRLRQQRPDPRGDVMRSARGPLQLIGIRRKTIIIIQHRRHGLCAHRRCRCLPMRRNDHPGPRLFRQARHQIFEIASQSVETMAPDRLGIVHPETGSAAMRQEQGWLAGRNGAVGHGGQSSTAITRAATAVRPPSALIVEGVSR
jgi:hypothetical protein